MYHFWMGGNRRLIVVACPATTVEALSELGAMFAQPHPWPMGHSLRRALLCHMTMSILCRLHWRKRRAGKLRGTLQWARSLSRARRWLRVAGILSAPPMTL